MVGDNDGRDAIGPHSAVFSLYEIILTIDQKLRNKWEKWASFSGHEYFILFFEVD